MWQVLKDNLSGALRPQWAQVSSPAMLASVTRACANVASSEYCRVALYKPPREFSVLTLRHPLATSHVHRLLRFWR